MAMKGPLQVENVQFSSKLSPINPDHLSTSKGLADYIGCGRFGSTRICESDIYGIVVAKCFSLHGSKENVEKQVTSVKREADVLVRLNHPNIVKTFGLSSWDGNNLAIILEYVHCGSLDGLLRSDNVDSIGWILRRRHIRQIAAALAYLHYRLKMRLKHGDVKPDNILLDIRLNVKLSDFGAVNIIQATTLQDTTLNVKPTKQSTAFYAAPEMLTTTEGEVTVKADMYSLAMVIYEVVTRSRVFHGVQRPEHVVTNAILNGERPKLSVVENIWTSLIDKEDEQICSQLIGVMKKCWHGNPAKRPSSKEVETQLQCSDPKEAKKLKEEVKTLSDILKRPNYQTQRDAKLSWHFRDFRECVERKPSTNEESKQPSPKMLKASSPLASKKKDLDIDISSSRVFGARFSFLYREGDATFGGWFNE